MPLTLIEKETATTNETKLDTHQKVDRGGDIAKDLGTRVIIVGPFKKINSGLAYHLTEANADLTIDKVEISDTATSPYINVPERERGKAQPFCIIDFQLMHLRGENLPNPVHCVPFFEYLKHAKPAGSGKARFVYLRPNHYFVHYLATTCHTEVNPGEIILPESGAQKLGWDGAKIARAKFNDLSLFVESCDEIWG